MKNTIISIGGSIIYPDEGLNTKFLKEFNSLIRQKIAEDKNQRFFIIVGGGHTKKEYHYSAEQIIGHVKPDDLDWLGIHATELNAHLLRTIFRDIAKPEVISDYDKQFKLGDKRIIICAGWKPGWSTDFDMVLLAKEFQISKAYSLITVSNIFDKDPNIFPDAIPLERLNWGEYRNMIGDYWTPQRQLPFDPFGAKLAQQIGLSVVFLYGNDILNLKKALEGKKFKGTIIE